MRKHSKGATIMSLQSSTTSRSKSLARCVGQLGIMVLAFRFLAQSTLAQTLIYQEGFNSDGETNVPPRYTTTGRDVYEVPRIQVEIPAPNNFDQKGPIY